MSLRTLSFGLVAGITLVAAPFREAHAQSREPLCVVSQTQRLLRAETLLVAQGDRIAAAPLASRGPAGEQFVVVVPEVVDALSHSAPAPRTVSYNLLGGLVGGGSGFAVLRLDDQMHVVGDRVFVPHTARNPPVAGRSRATTPLATTLDTGVLVLERVGDDLYSTVIPATGAIPPETRVLAAPAPVEGTARGFEWFTLIARHDGAIALAGTVDGQVFSLRFDPSGHLRGNPSRWDERVGGPMQLLPTNDGPVAALLGRPVRGTGPHNEQARMQVLVALDDALRPAAQPFATGFAQFPLAMVQRGRSMMLFQWAEQQGVAISTLPIGDRRFGEQLPRLYYAQPPLDGNPVGHAATLGAGNIAYDVSLYGETQLGLHGHVTWLAPSGTPYIRRDVLALGLDAALPPVVFPASDGVVVITIGDDETGGAVDAYHVRCDLVALPQSAP